MSYIAFSLIDAVCIATGAGFILAFMRNRNAGWIVAAALWCIAGVVFMFATAWWPLAVAAGGTGLIAFLGWGGWVQHG